MTRTNQTSTVSPADLYLARRSTPASQATARSALNAAAQLLGADGYATLDWALTYSDAALIRAGANSLEPGWAKVVWSSVRQVVAEARRLGLIDGDTAASIHALPAPSGSGGNLGRTPSANEVADMLSAAAADMTIRGRRDAALVAVLAGCGLRRSEAAALRVGDLDLMKCTVLIRSGKGRRQRLLPLPSWVVDFVREWVMTAGVAGALFCGVDRWGNLGQRQLSGHAVNEIVGRLAIAAGVEPITCHGFRRFAVTTLIRSTGDTALAQRLAGHADVSTTIRCYDARGFDDLSAAMATQTAPGAAPALTAAA